MREIIVKSERKKWIFDVREELIDTLNDFLKKNVSLEYFQVYVEKKMNGYKITITTG